MKNSLGDEWTIFYPLYQEIHNSLSKMDWYKSDDWNSNIFITPERCGLILEKPSWKHYYIYFVSWVGEHELRANNTKVALCVELDSPIRKQFALKIIGEPNELFSDPNYKTSSKNRFVLFNKIRPLDKATFIHTLLNEFNKVQQLGSAIDNTIHSIHIFNSRR